MRPKKQILLVGSNEDRLGILAYMLQVNGFAVSRAFSSAEGVERLRQRRRDLLICDLPFDGAQSVLDAGRQANPFMHSMVLRGKLDAWEGCADVEIVRGICAEELLDRVKVLCARKRGPKPYRIPPVGVQIEEMLLRARRA
jgi:DNA-binding response OmpR family regulator